MLKAWCDHCQRHQPVIIEPLEKDDLNLEPWADVVCKVCSLVLLTFSADKPGQIVFAEKEDHDQNKTPS